MPHADLLRRVRIRSTAAVLCGALVLACAWASHGRWPASPRAAEALEAPDEAVRAADRSLATFQRFAVNLLLLPLIDDAEPPRWTTQIADWTCEDRSKVTIDGRPLADGEPVPAVAFFLRFALHGCAPLSEPGFVVDGIVDMTVFHDDDGLSAVVDTTALRIATQAGVRQMSGRFANVAPVRFSDRP